MVVHTNERDNTCRSTGCSSSLVSNLGIISECIQKVRKKFSIHKVECMRTEMGIGRRDEEKVTLKVSSHWMCCVELQ